MLRLRNQIRVTSSANGKQAVTGNPIQRRTPAVATSAKKQETAYFGYGNPGRGGMSVNVLPQGAMLYDTMLSGLIGENEESNLRFYRDIYDYDSVAGACVDLMSTMPFSDFSLVGCEVTDRIATYESSIERLDLRTRLPEVSIDYLVTGAFISTLLYKSSSKKFVDMISWKRENCDITRVPFLGIDPLIKVKPDADLQEFINSSEPQLVKMRKSFNASMLDALRSDNVELDPLTTIFIPRKTYTYNTTGTSFLRRVLPIYMMEKSLYRGTLVEAGRRQRAMLHVAMGDDIWEPTSEEMQAIVALFQQADLDPLGAIVGTRGAVQSQELRPGGDFWKYTDLSDQTTPMKLRALGISESFLSGDATYASMEVSLSVFVENLRNYRNMVTNRVFNGKIFPLVAYVNGYFKSDKGRDKNHDGKVESAFGEVKLQHNLNDATMLDMPQVHWQKALRPEADQSYLEVLGTLKDAGVPLPLSMWASAGGLTMDNLLKELEDDQNVQKKIEKLTGKKPNTDGDMSMEESAIRTLLNKRSRPLLSRNFDGFEYSTVTKTGKKKSIVSQTRERDRQYDHLAKATRNMQNVHHANQVLSNVRSRLGGIPDLYGVGRNE